MDVSERHKTRSCLRSNSTNFHHPKKKILIPHLKLLFIQVNVKMNEMVNF